VLVGLTVIDGEVCPPGDQRYVPPPTEGVVVSVAELPEHIVGLFTLTEGV
jgi:hypothetical protein